ncbi:VOC family protein [Streptomyces sp. NPDC101393]|uniref:VOC family protein n=1 Tax=Streptomyces sp. NPDC101393 TaxID=3366141 RepID=UPI00381DB1F0
MPVSAAHVEPVRGAPCWVNLLTHDLRAAKAFYSEVLGWSFRRGSLGEEFAVALLDGQPVAGISALAPGLRTAVAWTPYFAVDDADDTADRVRERGATVAVGPLKFGWGRAALAADRDGAVFGFWEGLALPWSIGEGRAPGFLELRTRDAFDAAIFYGGVFDWSKPGGCEVNYAHDRVQVSDRTHTVATLYGGAVEAAPDPQVRPRWRMHLRVDDVAAVTAAALAAGGTVLPMTPVEGRPGNHAVVRDPDGAFFAVTDSP